MYRTHIIFLTALIFANVSFADSIELNNGKTIEGSFVGREGDSIKFEVDGITMTFNAGDVKTINMGTAAPSSPTAETSTAPAEPTVAVPSGSTLKIRLQDALNSGQHTQGHKFTGTLEGALVVNGSTIAPAGSAVYGEVTEATKAGRVAGKASLLITITGIKLNDQIITISTNSINALTVPTGASSAGKVARGAAIGALADGSSGARKGAKIGAGAAVLSGGNQVVIPPGTLIDFQLTQPLSAK